MAEKKVNKSIIKSVLLGIFFVVIILMYVNHLADTSNEADNSSKGVDRNEMTQLIEYDMDSQYPKTPRELVKLHCRYYKLVYGNNLSDEELATVSSKMRKLYSSELLAMNPENAALTALKADIKKVNEEGYTYKSYTLPETSQIVTYTQNGKEMATMEVTLILGVKKEVGYMYIQYVTVKEDGRWKILAWGESQMGKENAQ